MGKTLGDVRDAGADILAECRACRRSAIVPLIHKFGANRTLIWIGRRMRCMVCGAREAVARPDDFLRPGYRRFDG